MTSIATNGSILKSSILSLSRLLNQATKHWYTEFHRGGRRGTQRKNSECGEEAIKAKRVKKAKRLAFFPFLPFLPFLLPSPILSNEVYNAIDFNRDIRPILADKCWGCHGPDATAKKIKLRLDSETASTPEPGTGRRANV